ncbi:VPS10 domain-containing receptor SorCS2-like [Melanotaenia boesemani]|uniref:VPS10 domain-containing receptor SorCS2-like n=1 Tax=Melanotaenia boesemani TaxID=1250792 RepID=UPI001C055B45|nr:VPS10 domain-containing receptor SorCS2-like [Melanotaenia boesemani]
MRAICILYPKLDRLGLNTSLCNWLLDFLTGRPQAVRVGSNTSRTIILNTGAPQGCVLSPLLFTLLTHDCTPLHSSNLFIKFADDTTVVGLISNGDETNYRSEVNRLALWRVHPQHAPLTINGAAVERTFYRGTLESILSSSITVWYGSCTASCRKTLQRIVRTAEKIIGAPLPSLYDIYCTRLTRKALGIAGDPTHPVFGHISYRSDWELVKVDFRQSFPRQCTESDYESWQLTDLQGEKCIMGQERTFRKRKDTAFCIKGKSYTSALTSKPCTCTEKDFNCDYGFERSHVESDRCFADFWYDPDSPPEDCHLGQNYKSSTGYRKVISNTCEGGLNKQQSSKQHSCPLLPPKGLQVGIKGQMLAVAPGDDITFIVHQEQGDTSTTKYQVDLGDGVRAIYQNLTVTDEPIQHRYEKPGVYKVTVKAENMAGHDKATMYIQVTAPLQEVHLEVIPIAGRNHEVNMTAVVLPTEANMTVFYWWIGDSLQYMLET